jgi:hypothetical protein
MQAHGTLRFKSCTYSPQLLVFAGPAGPPHPPRPRVFLPMQNHLVVLSPLGWESRRWDSDLLWQYRARRAGRFHSAFTDVDASFGSRGSFFEADFSEGVVEVVRFHLVGQGAESMSFQV